MIIHKISYKFFFTLSGLLILTILTGCVLERPQFNESLSVKDVIEDSREKQGVVNEEKRQKEARFTVESDYNVLITYTNKELGFSFEYPKQLGNVIVSFERGETGVAFHGKFEARGLYFGGVSQNYSSKNNRSLVLTDTTGFERKQYYHFKFPRGSTPVEHDQVLQIKNGEEAVLFGYDDFINLRGTDALLKTS